MANKIAGLRPLCSVCIANYNGNRSIDACIESVLNQDCDFSYEIIVHDDASTDGSADHIATRYPDVLLIKSDSNVGYCVSNNRMVSRASGQYLLLLNNDATLEPDALRTLHSAAEDCSLPSILSLPQYDAADGKLLDRGYLLDPFLNPVPCLDASGRLGMVIGACFWIPRFLWDELDGFPEWFGSLAEDMYLCLAARLSGYDVKVSPRSGYHHWVGQSLGGGNARNGRLISTFKRRSLSERNKTFVMILCYPRIALILILPLHVLLLILEGAVLALACHDLKIFTQIYLRALISIYTHRRILMDRRRRTQKNRSVNLRTFFSSFTFFPQKIRMLMQYGLPRVVR